jgi:hypothetical protein
MNVSAIRRAIPSAKFHRFVQFKVNKFSSDLRDIEIYNCFSIPNEQLHLLLVQNLSADATARYDCRYLGDLKAQGRWTRNFVQASWKSVRKS